MDGSHSLTLNEEAFKQIPDHKKPVYVFEWLRYLDKGLVAAQKVSAIIQMLILSSDLYMILIFLLFISARLHVLVGC